VKNVLLAIIGLNGSGKDTVADYIQEKHGFTKKSLSDIVRIITCEEGMDPSKRDDLNFVADKNRKIMGPGFLAKIAIKDYKEDDKLVLSSFRHPKEIEIVKEKGGIVIKIDVPLEIRFKRTVKRKELDPTDHGSVKFDEFLEKEKRELSNPDYDKMQINEVMELYDYIIDNSGSLEELKEKIDILLKEII
jgi:dephospho-CoA kinase